MSLAPRSCQKITQHSVTSLALVPGLRLVCLAASARLSLVQICQILRPTDLPDVNTPFLPQSCTAAVLGRYAPCWRAEEPSRTKNHRHIPPPDRRPRDASIKSLSLFVSLNENLFRNGLVVDKEDHTVSTPTLERVLLIFQSAPHSADRCRPRRFLRRPTRCSSLLRRQRR